MYCERRKEGRKGEMEEIWSWREEEEEEECEGVEHGEDRKER